MPFFRLFANEVKCSFKALNMGVGFIVMAFKGGGQFAVLSLVDHIGQGFEYLFFRIVNVLQ